MTISMRRTARLILRPLLILAPGCQSAPRDMSSSKTALGDRAQSAAAMEQSNSVAAQAIASIDIARQVVMNNISNAETTAFKGSRINFEDASYKTLRLPGATNGVGDISPSGTYVGLGSRISNTQIDFTQGSLTSSGRPLDVGIQGEGFFKVQVLSTLGDGTAYTRNGNFFLNDKNEIVVGTGDGNKLLPEMKVPTGATNITISTDGVITAIKPGGNAPTVIGQMKLTQFVNAEGLNILGGTFYQETVASGPPIDSKPGDQGSGSLLQDFLEGSNVNLSQETIHLQFLNRWRATLMQAMGMQGESI